VEKPVGGRGRTTREQKESDHGSEEVLNSKGKSPVLGKGTLLGGGEDNESNREKGKEY